MGNEGMWRENDVEALLLHSFDKNAAQLARHILDRLIATGRLTRADIDAIVAKLKEPDNLDDLRCDFPRVEEYLAEATHEKGRLHVLAVRNGFDFQGPTVRALHMALGMDFRAPGSTHIASTGNEDAHGKGEQEMAQILKEHVKNHQVDVVMAYSRGCRLLAEHLLSAECIWAGPIILLSPAGEWGAKLLRSNACAVIVAVSDNDLVGHGGSHPVITEEDLEDMRCAVKEQGPSRHLVLAGVDAGIQGWANEVAGFVHKILEMVSEATHC